ncbi:MAG TPA: hypothetical protein VNO22_04045 [Planctomycetota bacterium]|jgi:hypothetical protein|nr:hypothetical protein [Planctomycetota bacterium]
MIVRAAQLWAIATMTLLEARRRKVFAVLILFALALLSAVAFFPSVAPEGRLRLVEIWALRAAAVFTAIVALFLAGFSLPGDFEQKRIFLVVTKPVPKGLVFLGRFAGFALLLAIFVATLGAVTVFFLRVVSWTSGKDFPPLVAYPRERAASFTHARGVPHPDEPGRLAAAAADEAVLVWTFRGLNRADFPERLRVEARLTIGSPTDPYRSAGLLHVRARAASGRAEELRIPANTNEERLFEVPADLVEPAGTLELTFRSADADGMIAGDARSVVLYRKPSSFELNFARGMALVLLQSLIVLSVTLAASTWVSAPVSILLGILVYLVGSAHGFIREAARDVEFTLREAPGREERVRPAEDLPPWVLKASTRISRTVLALVPDFSHFDFSRWLLKDHAVSGGELAEAAGRAAPPVLVLAILGTALLYFRDFG